MPYQTNLKCPVCGEVMDTITHPEPIANSYGLALVGGGGRRNHALKSPSCTRDDRWVRGWDEEPVGQVEPEPLPARVVNTFTCMKCDEVLPTGQMFEHRCAEKAWPPEGLKEALDANDAAVKRERFRRALAEVLNSHSWDNRLNMPDYVLAELLASSLEAAAAAQLATAKHLQTRAHNQLSNEIDQKLWPEPPKGGMFV